MQEYNNEKIIAMTVKTANINVGVLKSVIKKFLSEQKKSMKPKVIRGKQSLKQLIRGNDNASVTNI